MTSIVVWDVEFLTDVGAPQRFWCGPNDPDPVLVQIGAVRLGLTGDFSVSDTFDRVVVPRDRAGAPWPLAALFTRLTGIDAARIDKEGVELGKALSDFADFAEKDRIWAWGNDELFAVAISCYLAGVAAPLPATRFGNASRLVLKAGEPLETVQGLRSDRLAAHFGLSDAGDRAHDALGDARSTARALQFLLREGRLVAEDFDRVESAST